MLCDRIDTFSPSRITLSWKFCRKNVACWACTRNKASINDSMGGTDVVCPSHAIVVCPSHARDRRCLVRDCCLRTRMISWNIPIWDVFCPLAFPVCNSDFQGPGPQQCYTLLFGRCSRCFRKHFTLFDDCPFFPETADHSSKLCRASSSLASLEKVEQCCPSHDHCHILNRHRYTRFPLSWSWKVTQRSAPT